MKRLIISFILIFTLSACMMEPYKLALDKDAGPYPENYLEIINGFLDQYLENPESIKDLTIIQPPKKRSLKNHRESISLAQGNEIWECFIAFDAKNSQGKTVRDFHVVWIRNDRVVAFDYNKPSLDYRFKHRFDPVTSPEDIPENPEENTPTPLEK